MNTDVKIGQTRRSNQYSAETPKNTLIITRRDVGDVHVLDVHGIIDARASGSFCDTLVGAVQSGQRALIADLSGVSMMTRSGARGLVVAAKLLQAARGDTRIAGATGTVRDLLKSMGYRHLLKCDATLSEAIERIVLNRPAVHFLPQVCRFSAG